jgi:MraZ protein
VHPLEEWQRIETKLREQSIFNPEVRELSRLFVSRAKDVSLDAAGRVLIPPDVREQAGLSKEVTLVGGGLPQFEVWDRGRFDEYERTRADRLPTLFERLSGLGV